MRQIKSTTHILCKKVVAKTNIVQFIFYQKKSAIVYFNARHTMLYFLKQPKNINCEDCD